MSESTFPLLLQYTCSGKTTLLIADENLRGAPFSRLPATTVILTNRFDLQQQSSAAGLESTFNDLDFSIFQSNFFDQILYRVSKEKPVVHHIINHVKKLLKNDGQLVLIGAKNEGLKTYAKKTAMFFSSTAVVTKQKQIYCAVISKNGATDTQYLDEKNYPELRAEISDDTFIFFSKPGVFGWNKIDRGSAYLIENLPSFFSTYNQPLNTLLDLGCGYGYLSVMTHRLLPETVITATDNNAAAIMACKKNFQHHQVTGTVVASDCGSEIEEKFDAVLCNPPFHQGFDTEEELTERFVGACYKRLKPNGKALFVVNRFVALERKATPVFRTVSKLAENQSFKIILLEK